MRSRTAPLAGSLLAALVFAVPASASITIRGRPQFRQPVYTCVELIQVAGGASAQLLDDALNASKDHQIRSTRSRPRRVRYANDRDALSGNALQ